MSDRIVLPPLVEIKEISDSKSLNEAFEIRKEVFVKEQNVDPAEEYDAFEESSTHFLLLYDKVAVATGRFRSTEKGWKVERMAVLKDFRQNAFGGLILQSLLAAIPRDDRPIYLHAQEHALGFYLKHQFEPEGERFWEANIPHFKAVYKGT